MSDQYIINLVRLYLSAMLQKTEMYVHLQRLLIINFSHLFKCPPSSKIAVNLPRKCEILPKNASAVSEILLYTQIEILLLYYFLEGGVD